MDDQISNGVNTDIHRFNHLNISYFENIKLTQITDVYATETIMKATLKHYVKKLGYDSITNAFGHVSKENPGTERNDPACPFTKYKLFKK